MPRSFAADRFERHSLSRAEKGSLGRYSVATDISLGSAATQHWVNSVSDIYGPDEIEELLEDLNRLEMASFDADDFDIDGSQIGYGGMTAHGHQGGGDRGGGPPHHRNSSPSDDHLSAPPAHLTASPTWSVKSWDSHTHYQEFKEPEDDPVFFPSRPMQSIVCYCDMSTFKTPRTILRVLLVVTSIACLSTLLTAGTAKTGFFALPHFPRLRLMMFVTIFGIIFTIFVLFLNISHLHALLPVDYGKLQTVAYLLLTAAYAVASSLVLHSHQTGFEIDNEHPPLPNWTKHQILIASLLGFVCAFETFLCSFNCGRPPPSYDKMPESSTHFTLHETVTTRAVTNESIPHHTSQLANRQASKQPKSGSAAVGGTAGGGSCLPVPPNARYHQYLVNENYDSDRVVTGAARALTKSASNNATHNHSDSSHNNNHNHNHQHNNNNNHNKNNNNSNNHHHQNKPDSHAHQSSKSTQQPVKGHPVPANPQQPSSKQQPRTPVDQPDTGPGRQTGAIPKQKAKQKTVMPSANHLDEIVALPLDDL